MIRFNCSHCGKSISVKDEHAGKRGKCPACRQPVSIPSIPSATAAPPALPSPRESFIPAQNPDVPEFEWPNFNTDAEEPQYAQRLDSPPLPLSVTAPDVRHGSLPRAVSTIQQLDPQARIAALAAVFGLVLLAVSPFFKWMNIGSGGMIGLKVFGGGVVLGVTLLAIGICVVVLIKPKWLKAGVLLVQAWGTVAVFWMAILIWGLGSVFDSSEINDNPFAGLFAMQSGPGAGLYLGLIGALVVAAALGFVAVRCLLASGSLKPYIVTQGLSVAFGIWWVFSIVAFGPSKHKTAMPNGPDPIVNEPVVEKPIPIRKIRSTGAIAVGITEATIDYANVQSSFEAGVIQTEEKYLLCTFQVTNTDKRKILTYRDESFPGDYFSLKDDVDNTIRDVSMGSSRQIFGSISSGYDIQPGEKVIVVKAFKIPPTKTEHLILSLNLPAFSGTGQLKYKLEANEIKGFPPSEP